MKNYVSNCCHRAIVASTKVEFPLGGYRGQAYKVDVCESCGLEIDEPLAVTECCGEVVCECVIEKSRIELVKKAETLGLDHLAVLEESQRFDRLHNAINRRLG